MNKTKVYADYLIFIMIVFLILMVMEFLALTDIYHEYVSKAVLSGTPRKNIYLLPKWTDAIAEWKVVNFCFTARLILIIIALILSKKISNKNREEEPEV